MRRSSFLLAAALLFAVPAVAYAAVNLMSAGGFLYDVQETFGGYLNNGTIDAYDGMYRLRVDGTAYTASGPVTMTMGGRQVEMAEQAIGGLMVKRLVYVPAAGGEYARFIDVVRNPGAADVMTTIEIYGNLGSDFSTMLTATSSGDTTLDIMDDWFATDDTPTGGDPSLAHVAQGGGGAVRATTITQVADNLSWSFTATVPAGGQVAVLTFALQAMDQPRVQAEAARVVDLPSDAIAGADAYLPDVINFAVGGAPLIRFTGPAAVDEGSDIMVGVEVTDIEMDPTTWSWDLDDDGTFGETPMAASAMISGAGTDGPQVVRVGVEASDGVLTRQRYRSITINNVAPEITSLPSRISFVGTEWRYDLTWTDPAGTRDLPIFTFLDSPSGMVVSRGGTVTWTPSAADRSMVFPVDIQVDDGDGGVTNQMFDLSVAANRDPGDPEPLSPIDRTRITDTMPNLVTRNATDPDGDRLSYFFRIDSVSSFDSAFLIESPEVVETMGGMTSWTVPTNLTPGIWYWQVKASDGLAETSWVNASFIVGEAAPDAGPAVDAGPRVDSGVIAPPPPTGRADSGGCGCRVAGRRSGAPGALALAGLLAAVALWRRRRSAA